MFYLQTPCFSQESEDNRHIFSLPLSEKVASL